LKVLTLGITVVVSALSGTEGTLPSLCYFILYDRKKIDWLCSGFVCLFTNFIHVLLGSQDYVITDLCNFNNSFI